MRKNSYKEWKTPRDIIQEYGLPIGVLILPPIIIDEFIEDRIFNLYPSEYTTNFVYDRILSHHVPDYPDVIG